MCFYCALLFPSKFVSLWVLLSHLKIFHSYGDVIITITIMASTERLLPCSGVLTTCFLRLIFEKPTFRMRSESSNGLRHSGGPSKYRDQIPYRFRLSYRFIVILSVITLCV